MYWPCFFLGGKNIHCTRATYNTQDLASDVGGRKLSGILFVLVVAFLDPPYSGLCSSSSSGLYHLYMKLLYQLLYTIRLETDIVLIDNSYFGDAH